MKRMLLTITMLVCFFNGYAEKTDSLEIYKSRCDSLTAVTDSLSAIVEGLYPVRMMVAKDTDRKYVRYHEKKFTEQNPAEIDSVLSVAGSLRIDSLSELISNLENAKSLKKEYDSLYSLVSEQAYDANLIKDAMPRANSLLARVSSKEQKKEVETIKTALSTYRNAMNQTKELVEWISETMDLYRPNGSRAGAKSSLESILGSQTNVIAIINKVPYLKKLFDGMVSDLRNDPRVKGKNEARLIELTKTTVK